MALKMSALRCNCSDKLMSCNVVLVDVLRDYVVMSVAAEFSTSTEYMTTVEKGPGLCLYHKLLLYICT